MNPRSAAPVSDREVLNRFVFSMMHIDKNSGRLKPNFFDYAFSHGLSVQRSQHAGADELAAVVQCFLDKKPKAAWVGAVRASVISLRSVKADGGQRAFGIYDAPDNDEPANTAHAEVMATRYVIEDADRLEAERALFRLFGDGHLQSPSAYFRGEVWPLLSQEQRDRKVDDKVDMSAITFGG